jgi:F-type H+-transporting ATPase subunit b
MRRGGMLLVLVLALVALSRAQAGAEPQRGDEGNPAAANGAKKGLAETDKQEAHDPFSQALDLTIWTVVVFLVLLFVLRRFAWKPMLNVLQQREQTIRESLERAQQEREAAERLRLQHQREMEAAHDQVRQLMDQARRDSQRNADELIARAKAEAQAERQRLHREIETARDQALQQIWGQMAQLAAAVSSKAIRRELTPEDHRSLVDEALVEFQQARRDARPA